MILMVGLLMATILILTGIKIWEHGFIILVMCLYSMLMLAGRPLITK